MAFLNRSRLRVVERNDRGLVTYRKRYSFGDEVDTSHMDEAHVDRLLETGALVESKDDLRDPGGPTNPVPGSALTGGATGEAADHSDADTGEQYGDDETDPANTESVYQDGANVNQVNTRDDGEDVDEFSGMDYSELQTAARARGLSAGGSADALRERLRGGDSDSGSSNDES